MLSVEEVKTLIGSIHDPILDVPLKETDGIVNVTIKEEIEHVSIKFFNIWFNRISMSLILIFGLIINKLLKVKA